MPGDNNVGFALRYKFSIKINSVEFEDGFTRSDGRNYLFNRTTGEIAWYGAVRR